MPSKPSSDVYEYLPPPLEKTTGFYHEETNKEKFIRKFKEAPLVPLGCGLTTAALTYGLYQMRTGNRFMSQRMMRLRVLAQGFTVIALLAGVIHTAREQRETKKPQK